VEKLKIKREEVSEMKALKVFVVLATVLLLTEGNAVAGKKISFTNYPNLKLGFTTVVFMRCGLGPSLENALVFIDYASDRGYAWIELRDPNGILTVAECKAIAAYAKDKKIEMAYAANRGPLDADYWQVLGNSWRNASVFAKGPKTVRVVDSNAEFGKDPNKKAWTGDEFKKALETQNGAAKGIKDQGLQLVIENANLPVKGEFGFEAFMEATDKAVGFQFDTANMFAVSRVRTDPKDAEQVFKKFASRIHYTHLKTSVNGVAQPVLTDNELDLGMIFSVLGKNKKNYIAIELAQAETFDEQKTNLEKSLEFLKGKGFITVK
jgi:sugar phosphate isomerase/epimerase